MRVDLVGSSYDRCTTWRKSVVYARRDLLFEKAGFSRSLRQKAVQALSSVYTPIVLQALRTGPDRDFVAPIFGFGWPLLVISFLEVGVDLHEIGASALEAFRKRLLVPRQFRDAAFELRVWATVHGCSILRRSRAYGPKGKRSHAVSGRQSTAFGPIPYLAGMLCPRTASSKSKPYEVIHGSRRTFFLSNLIKRRRRGCSA